MSRRAALSLLAAVSLLRLGLAPTFDLMPQSAYYFTAYAEHPSLSYYDHPPMIGYLLWLASSILGDSALVIRMSVLATTLATLAAFWRLAGHFLGERQANGALVLLSTTGLVTLVSFIAVPDVPLLLFWTLALLALRGALFDGRRALWPAAGAAMGLAFLSKYTAVFLQGGLILFLLASPKHRRLLRTPWPWLSLLVAQVVSLPVYVWNLRHSFASFLYQSAGRAEESRFDPGDVFGFLGSQLLILLPVLFALFVVATVRSLRSALPGGGRLEEGPDEAGKTLFLLSFALPVFATCIALSTMTWVKVNWAMPAYLTGTILAARAAGGPALRWQVATSALLHAVIAVQLVAYPVPVLSDDTWYGWSELAAEVEERVAERPDDFVFAADHYKTTAELRFYTDLEVYGMNVIGWNALHYGYLGEDLEALAGRDALFVRSEERLRPSDSTERYLKRIERYFDTVEEVEPIRIRRRGETVRLFRVFRCTGYRRPNALPKEARAGAVSGAGACAPSCRMHRS